MKERMKNVRGSSCLKERGTELYFERNSQA